MVSRSNVERVLSRLVVSAAAAPSDMAVEAIVAGVPVEATRPGVSRCDVVFPPADSPLP